MDGIEMEKILATINQILVNKSAHHIIPFNLL